MHEVKILSVYQNDHNHYLFEFIDTKQRGIFVAEATSGKKGDRFEVHLYDDSRFLEMKIMGTAEWINKTSDVGIGIIADQLSKEDFKRAIKVVKNVAYI